MALVTEQPTAVFDLSLIKRGDLLWAKHSTWDEGRAGFVTSATESQLIVQYQPSIGNVTNHFVIPVSEAKKGEWKVRWSADMTDIQEYGIQSEPEQEQPVEGGEGNEA